jgi:glyoxylate/hydroxypyruvate reductase A
MAIAMLVGASPEETKRFDWFINGWKKVFYTLDSTLDIRVWPEVGSFDDIEAAFVWRHKPGALLSFSNLKIIHSLAAGVDHILTDKNLKKEIPIARVKDPYMANDIVQYVLVTVLQYIKRMDDWANNQKQSLWTRKPPINFSHKTIGIMGLGFLGEKAAKILADVGLKVVGWSQSQKKIPGVNCFSGKNQFQNFLSQSDVLVCMLPLTRATENILNQEALSYLPQDAYVINLGRGEHLVEADLINALNSNKLSGACIDVMRKEPCPADHLFWQHPKIKMTPHIASVTNPETAAPQILENYRRAISGNEILNVVDIDKGY